MAAPSKRVVHNWNYVGSSPTRSARAFNVKIVPMAELVDAAGL